MLPKAGAPGLPVWQPIQPLANSHMKLHSKAGDLPSAIVERSANHSSQSKAAFYLFDDLSWFTELTRWSFSSFSSSSSPASS
jgi:hypothetical protein